MAKSVSVPTYYIGMDSGKYLTKMLAGDNVGKVIKDQLLTKMVPYYEDKPLPGIKGNVIELNGERYLIGSQGNHNTETTKMTDVHRLATYTALARNIPNGSDIHICIGCTLSQWTNKQARRDYIRFMLNMDEEDTRKPNTDPIEIEFKVDGEPYKYTVKKIHVLPEASGYLLKYDEVFSKLNEDIAIIDIGGLNVNGAIYRPNLDDELEIDMESVFTLEDGSNPYKLRLRQELNSKLQLGLQERDMDRVLKNGFVRHQKDPSIEETSKKIISIEKNKLIDKIVNYIRGLGWNTNTLRFIFIGGGSLLFENEIKNHRDLKSPTLIVSENAQWDNVEGFALGAGLDIEIIYPILS